jgi:hypothetical protein
MHNLPLVCVGFGVGNKIGSFVNYMEDVDTDEDGVDWGKILRVKIHVDLTKPPLRGFLCGFHSNMSYCHGFASNARW